MTTAELRTLIGQIRLSCMQANISNDDAKSQLQNIDWSSVVESPGITVSLMQDIVTNTIKNIEDGKLR